MRRIILRYFSPVIFLWRFLTATPEAAGRMIEPIPDIRHLD